MSGGDYIKYGGDTTCLEIRTRSDDIIIVLVKDRTETEVPFRLEEVPLP